jgi:hypothetical protein
MLTVAAELDLVTCLLAVVAAVLPVRTLGLDGALTGRVSTFRRSSHVEPPLGRTLRLFMRAHKASRAVDELRPFSGNAIDEVPPVELPFIRYGRAAKSIRLAVVLPDHPNGNRDGRLRERNAEGRLRQCGRIALADELQTPVADIDNADERIVYPGAQLGGQATPRPPPRDREILSVLGYRKAPFDNCQQLRGLHRLQQEVGAQFPGLGLQTAIGEARDDDHGDPLWIDRRQVQTVEFRQAQIRDDQVRSVGREQAEGLRHRRRFGDVVPRASEELGHTAPCGCVVFDNEDSESHARP